MLETDEPPLYPVADIRAAAFAKFQGDGRASLHGRKLSARYAKNLPEPSHYEPHRHRELNQPKRREEGEYDIAAK